MQQSAKIANGSALIGQNMENAARTGHIWSKNAGEVARNAVSKKKKPQLRKEKSVLVPVLIPCLMFSSRLP